MNHRRVQRTLFRMLFDEDFARRVHEGEAEALAGHDEEEIRLLRTADPVAVSADREDRRRTQALGNLLKEFLLTASAADAAGLPFGTGFFRSVHFHEAVRDDRRLPLAFTDHAADQVRAWGRPEIATLFALEAGMVRARRERPERSRPASGELVLAPAASLLEVVAGTADYAAQWRARVESGGGAAAVKVPRPGATECLLLRRQPVPSAYTVPELAVEVLQPNVVEIFRAAESPLGVDRRRGFAEAAGAALEDLDAFLDGFVEEGSLIRGA